MIAPIGLAPRSAAPYCFFRPGLVTVDQALLTIGYIRPGTGGTHD
jgi:hypothetical protein